MLQVIIMTLAPIFFITMLGPLADRMRALDDLHVGKLDALVIDFALPASLFVATASSSRGEMMA
jgi:malonate transporter and related proteins